MQLTSEHPTYAQITIPMEHEVLKLLRYGCEDNDNENDYGNESDGYHCTDNAVDGMLRNKPDLDREAEGLNENESPHCDEVISVNQV